MKIILATKNAGKVKEFQKEFENFDIEVLSLADMGFDGEIEENGNTFMENALIKAKTIYDKYKIPTLSDDSGLCVSGIGGAPNIYSARFMGLKTEEERRRKVLELLGSNKNRDAYFFCALVLIDDSGIHTFEGRVDGLIGYSEKGSQGFGYDPIFYHNGLSFAEMSEEEKNKISHRGLAVSKLKEYLNGLNH